MVGVVAVAEQRQQLAIVAPNRRHRGSAGRGHDRGVVVEAAEPRVGIAFDIRRVRRAPVDAAGHVAKDVEAGAAERIAALERIGARRINRDAELRVLGARATEHVGLARRKGQAAAVVHRAARNRAGNIQDSRVVLIAAHAVGLHAQVRPDDELIGADGRELGHDDQAAPPRAAASVAPSDCVGRRNGSASCRREPWPSIAISTPIAARLATIAEPP